MAILDKITPEIIELMRGKIDFYMLRGILPVARKWPKKPRPPYSALQAEAQAVFSLANLSMHRLKPNILEAWRVSSFGVRASWTDVYRSITMKFWKATRGFPLIAIDYVEIETSTTFKVQWEILKLSLINGVPEEVYNIETNVINKSDIDQAAKPIYYTLLDDLDRRQVAPFIEYKL